MSREQIAYLSSYNSLPDGYRQCFVRMVWSELIQCIPRPQDWLLAFLNARYVTKGDA